MQKKSAHPRSPHEGEIFFTKAKSSLTQGGACERMATATADVDVEVVPAAEQTGEQDKDAGPYVVKNPKATGWQVQAFNGGVTLNEWDIEDEKFYANEGNQIARRNLWASIPNLLMGFAVWLMWSVTNAKIQQTHDKDPSVYYFKDFAGEYKGVSEGYRGCPGWYEESCCKTWKDIKDDDWKVWAKGVKDMSDADREAMGVPGGMDAFTSANDMMYSKAFSDMNLSPNATLCHGFGCAAVTGKVYGCPVDADRKADSVSATIAAILAK